MPSFIRSRILTGFLAVVLVWLLLSAAHATLRSMAARRELAELESRITDQRRGNERLQRQVERMREPAWLALLARARLNWRAPDETVVFVYKSEKSDTISPPQTAPDARSNVRKWWDWLLGTKAALPAGAL
jgi:cell division protein FtsB